MQDKWRRCPTGQLKGLVSGLRNAEKRAVVRRRAIVGAGTLAASLLLAGLFLFRGSEKATARVRPISCGEVRSHTQQILADTLDDSLKERVQAHLGFCRSCVHHLDEARAATAEATSDPRMPVAAL